MMNQRNHFSCITFSLNKAKIEGTSRVWNTHEESQWSKLTRCTSLSTVVKSTCSCPSNLLLMWHRKPASCKLISVLSLRRKESAETTRLFFRCRASRWRRARLSRSMFRRFWADWWSQWIVYFSVRGTWHIIYIHRGLTSCFYRTGTVHLS